MSSKRCSGNGNKMHITQLSSRAHNNEDLTMQRSVDSGVWPKMWNWKLKHIRVERRVLGEWMVSFIGEDLPWECSALIEMENGLYITLEVEIFIWYCRLKSAIWHCRLSRRCVLESKMLEPECHFSHDDINRAAIGGNQGLPTKRGTVWVTEWVRQGIHCIEALELLKTSDPSPNSQVGWLQMLFISSMQFIKVHPDVWTSSIYTSCKLHIRSTWSHLEISHDKSPQLQIVSTL